MAPTREKGGLHEDFRRSEPVEGSSDRSFGVVFSVFFAVLAFWRPLHGSGSFHRGALIASVVFLALAIAWPRVLSPLNFLWTRFGLILQRIVSPVVLGVLFFVVVTPVGLWMRIRGRDLLHLRLDSTRSSYWMKREEVPSRESMRQQF